MMAGRTAKIRIAGIVFLLTAIIASIIIVISLPQIRLSMAKGGTVLDGQIPDISASEHITDVPNGEVRYLINKNIVFKNKYSLGKFMFENPSSCEYALIFTVYDADGKQLYVSPEIKPGQYLTQDKLSNVVEPGTYKCGYTAQAYKDGEYAGEVSGVMTISVG